MTNLKLIYKLSILFISILIYANSYSQDHNGMYFMNMIPQTNYMNPAIRPTCNFYLGAPALSSMYLELNSALSFNDIFYKDTEPGSDSTVTFLASKEYQDDFLKKLDRSKNLFGFQNHLTIGSFGFKTDKLYFNFDLLAKTNVEMNIPSDFLRFFLNGNYNPTDSVYYNYDLSNFDVNANSHIEASIGVSYELNEQLTVGVRPKLIFGLFDMSSADQNASINSVDTAISFNTDFTLNAHIPGFDPEDYDQDGIIDSFLFDDSRVATDLVGNTGFGLDIGATYKYDDKINLYASIIDLGWINWKTNPNNMSIKGKYDFTGVDIEDYINTDDEEQNTSETDSGFALLDSLQEAFDISTKAVSYRTGLGAKIYLGGTYAVHEKIDIGLLSRSQIYRGRFRQQLTLSANFKPLKIFNASVSYTMKNYTFNNLGYTLAYKFGPLNSYVSIDKSLFTSYIYRDNIIINEDGQSIPLPHNFNRYTIKFGANLLFGCNGKKNKNVDEPIVD